MPPPRTNAAHDSYMPQLDGLRAIAVLLVLNHHYLHPDIHFPLRPVLDKLGPQSVRLFFVLSGFLITGILLRCRRDAGPAPQPLGTSLKQFYMRRFLRIFPLYYAVLFTAAALNMQDVRTALPWHAAYLTNIYYSYQNIWFDGPCSHFWSLAVEEQFYLLWPLLILALPRKLLAPTILAAFCVAPLFRITAGVALGPSPSISYLPFGCLDALAAGALLALLASPTFGNPFARRRLESVGLYVGLPIGALLFLLCVYVNTGNLFYWIALDTPLALFYAWLVSRACVGFRGPLGTLLAKGPLAYLGRISYGIYVYHSFVFWFLMQFCSEFIYARPHAFHYALATALTLAIASLSFYLFERPINNLKRFFPYAPRTAAPIPAPVELAAPLSNAVA